MNADCLVIGGGLGGSMAALRLAAAGREVLLLEREGQAPRKVCGEFLSPEAVVYLRQAGVDPVALGAATIRRLRLSTGNASVETDLPFTALSLSRSVLDTALLACAESEGVHVRRGIAVDRLHSREREWIAMDSRGTELKARTVFLATGAHDLRGYPRGAGVQNDLVGLKMHWKLMPPQIEALRGWMDLYLFPDGYGGLSLVENDVANLCFVLRRSALRSLGHWEQVVPWLCQQLPRIREVLSGSHPLWDRPLAISSIPYGYLAPRSSDGLWRVGDQAAVIPSFTGDGMSIALHSGAFAADCYLSGESAAAYQDALREQLCRGMQLATWLSRFLVTPAGRTAAPAALRAFPPLAQWIAHATRIPKHALACNQGV